MQFQRYKDLVWRFRNPYSQKWRAFLRLTPDWVSLRRLGQSRLLALTALVPFLGTLILFNETIVSYLTVSIGFVKSISTVNAADAAAAAQTYTLNRLMMAYFGLSLLGLGSFAFSLACPAEVKTHEGAMEYITAEQPLITSFNVGVLVERVALEYLHYNAEGANQAFWKIDLAYPEALQIQFRNLIETLVASQEDGTDVDRAEPLVSPEVAKLEEERRVRSEEELGIEIAGAVPRFGPGGRYLYNGRLDVELVAGELRDRIHFNRGFWQAVDSEARHHLTDLLMLRYRVANLSRPALRIAISAAYGVGFTTLLFPTVETFVRIAGRFLVRG